MTASYPSPAGPGHRLDRSAWLPPLGRGNGLDAPSWAPIADVDPELVDGLLSVLLDAGVPAYAAPVAWELRRHAGRRLRLATSHRLWVGAVRYATAEDVIRTELPRLIEDRGSSPRTSP